MKKKVVIFVGIILLVIILILVKNKFFDNKISDAVRFSEEYKTIDENNVFVYRDINEIIKIMENGTGIVYLGFPECPWCKTYVSYLNEVAKEVGIDKIYYFNILEDRKNNTDEYQKIVSILDKYLQYDEEGNKRIFVPNVSFHISGEIIGNDFETSLDTKGFKRPEDYWNEERIDNLKLRLKNYMEQIKYESGMCNDCNK